jgi:hypothetical protein
MLKKQAEPLLYAAFQPAVTSFGDNNFLVITTIILPQLAWPHTA